MNTTIVGELEPLGHEEALALQEAEFERTLDLLRSLRPQEWGAATECPDWDVRRMYLHVLGASEAGASMRENAHQMRAALSHRKHNGGPLEAALSSVQVREREELQPEAIVEELQEVAPRTIRGRRRVPGLLRRHARTTVDGPVHEKWTLGYLIDTIYLRDLWMHRLDACRATGREIELTAGHDGRIVADVVAEWARRHGQPFSLQLGGPAGGSFGQDQDSPEAKHLELDAVEFCRILAGREPASGLLATVVPF